MLKKILSYLISSTLVLTSIMIPKDSVMASTVSDMKLNYKPHVQSIGWFNDFSLDGQAAGTVGKALRLEALQFNLQSSIPNVQVQVQTHIQDIGWSNWFDSSQLAGTTGKSLRLEAIRLKLINAPSNYHIQYQAHVQNIGWQNWTEDGGMAGTTGKSLRIEAIKIMITNTAINTNTNTTTTTNNEEVVKTNLPITFSYFLDNHTAEVDWLGNPMSRSTVASFSNPNNLQTAEKRFQFLRINTYKELQSVEKFNSMLVGMGALQGQGQTFINAAKAVGIDPIYLISHSIWETGRGSSILAKGVTINQFKGQPIPPTTVYNFFAIGAVDDNAIGAGAATAYANGWTTPEKGITGGAKWIANNYIKRTTYPQTTVYYMRWDTRAFWHEYATDVNWPNGIAGYMNKFSVLYKPQKLTFDIPVYK